MKRVSGLRREDISRDGVWRLTGRPVELTSWVFVFVELAALPLWLSVGRGQWFFLDDWDFLAARKVGDFGDLFRPHNEHWSTFSVVVYRGLYGTVGLRSYVPYELVVVLLHLTAAALLFIIMRRAAIQPWVAVAAASLFALFGAGWPNIVRAIEMGFTGSLVCGLTHLLLADHDGALDWRDWLGLLVGLMGLMTSGVAVTMTIVVGAAVLLRRGWRLSLFHTAPLAICFAVWLVAIGHQTYNNSSTPGAAGVIRFVETGLSAAYQAIGQWPASGAIVALVLVGGLALAGAQHLRSRNLDQLAAPLALLLGSVVFLAITATGRGIFGAGSARAERYLHLVVAMTLPALAVAVSALVQRWRWLLPPAILLFLVGIPGNVQAAVDGVNLYHGPDQFTRQMMLSLPRDPLARHAPRSLRPDNAWAGQVTLGWLLDGVTERRIPAPRHISASDRLSNEFRLSFAQSRTGSPVTACRRVARNFTLLLGTGDRVGFYDATIVLSPADTRRLKGPPLIFRPADGATVVVLGDAGSVRISATSTSFPARVCLARA